MDGRGPDPTPIRCLHTAFRCRGGCTGVGGRVPRLGSPTCKNPPRLAVFTPESQKNAWFRDFAAAMRREALIRRHFRATALGPPPLPLLNQTAAHWRFREP